MDQQNHLLHHRYALEEFVGRGGMGAVFRARDTLFGQRLVAMKTQCCAGTAEAAHRLQQEAFLLASVSHARIPRIYDYFRENARSYLVMEYIEGKTLEEQLTISGCFSLMDTVDIALTMCDILAYLHSRQPPIIFRDLKLTNILLTPAGVYLIDFGAARRFKQGQKRDTTILLSRGYAAPEQYGTAQTSSQSDIYSLGVVLHRLLTGAFPGKSRYDQSVPLAPQYIPLLLLIGQMLASSPAQRPSLHTIQSILHQQQTHMRKETR